MMIMKQDNIWLELISTALNMKREVIHYNLLCPKPDLVGEGQYGFGPSVRTYIHP